jgi:hypothetical protein
MIFRHRINFSMPSFSCQMLRHGHQLDAFFPADFVPKSDGICIVAKNEQVALGNADAHESIHTAPHQGFADALSTVRVSDSQVVDVTAPPVMAAQRRPDDLVILQGHITQPGVALQKTLDTLFRVGIAEIDAFAGLPQGVDRFVVFDG